MDDEAVLTGEARLHTTVDVASYLEDMLAQFGMMAANAGHRTLAYLIDMARAEARLQRSEDSPA